MLIMFDQESSAEEYEEASNPSIALERSLFAAEAAVGPRRSIDMVSSDFSWDEGVSLVNEWYPEASSSSREEDLSMMLL